MSGLIGKKIGMTSLYDEEGKNLACTVIQAGPCIVTQVKNEAKDGYNSVQLGFSTKKKTDLTVQRPAILKRLKLILKEKLLSSKDLNLN